MELVHTWPMPLERKVKLLQFMTATPSQNRHYSRQTYLQGILKTRVNKIDESQIRDMFNAYNYAFNCINQRRSHFPNFNMVLRDICLLLGKNELIDNFDRLKSIEQTVNHGKILKNIRQFLGLPNLRLGFCGIFISPSLQQLAAQVTIVRTWRRYYLKLQLKATNLPKLVQLEINRYM